MQNGTHTGNYKDLLITQVLKPFFSYNSYEYK